jgi:uncharacterized protein (TIGR02453 family)
MLNKTTLDFLSSLNKNNNRDWFEKNRTKFEAAKNDIAELVKEMIRGMSKFDKDIAALEVKDCLYRIYRDVRFSKNKLPYKNNMGAYFSKNGRKSIFAGYYMHIQPGGNSFLAGGMYMPEPDHLKAIRQEIDYNSAEFKKIIGSKQFVKTFGSLQGEKTILAPKGYPKDHPEIELLKHKSLIVSHAVRDAQLMNKDFVKYATGVFKTMYPFIQFLNRAVG